MSSVVVSARVPVAMRDALDAEAYRHGRTRQEQIRAFLEQCIQSQTKPKGPANGGGARTLVRDETIVEYDEG